MTEKQECKLMGPAILTSLRFDSIVKEVQYLPETSQAIHVWYAQTIVPMTEDRHTGL
ncbi:hypothetical protein M1N56_07800 [Dehalococcoidia bacterium]|nr:hypothetical protein [Dehalococcoidia bacterium]